MAERDFNIDLSHRFDLMDKDYLFCRECLKQAQDVLILTNDERDKLIIENEKYFKKTTEFDRKIKNWRIFGVAVSVTLIGVITLVFI